MSRRTAMEPCPTCGSTDVGMVQLDGGHWLGTCKVCGEESSIHWSRPRARNLWNIDAKAIASRKTLARASAPGETPDDAGGVK